MWTGEQNLWQMLLGGILASDVTINSEEYLLRTKVLLLVYKALHGLAPSYISAFLNFKTYSRSLRSSCKEYLVVPRSRLKTYGDRAFSIAGPKLWNDLPLEIRKCASVATFKQSLKTFLFKLAYRL